MYYKYIEYTYDCIIKPVTRPPPPPVSLIRYLSIESLSGECLATGGQVLGDKQTAVITRQVGELVNLNGATTSNFDLYSVAIRFTAGGDDRHVLTGDQTYV